MAVGDAVQYCSGTGTEVDPYIPVGTNDEMCQGFINAIAVESSYVKLESLIDFSVHPTYKTGFTSAITFNCIKLYGDLDENGYPQYGISGLIRTPSTSNDAGSLFTHTASSIDSTLHGIKLINFVITTGASFNDAVTIISPSAGIYDKGTDFYNCSISGIIRTTCAGVRFGYGGNYGRKYSQLFDCSVYFNFIQGQTYFTNNSVGSIFSHATRSCFVIDHISYTQQAFQIEQCNYSTIYINNLNAGVYTDYNRVVIATGSNCSNNVLIAKIEVKKPYPFSNPPTVVCDFANSVIAISDLNGDKLPLTRTYPNTSTDFAGDTYHLEDLKNKQKLIDVGFLP